MSDLNTALNQAMRTIIALILSNATALQAALVARYPAAADHITAENLGLIGSLMVSIGLGQMLPISPLDLAMTLIALSPDAISVEKIAADLRENVAGISPSAAAAITPEFMRKIGIIMLHRVLESDTPIDFTREMRIWFSVLLDESGVDLNA